MLGRKGVKGLLLVDHEKVPHGFGLRTGGFGGDTADDVGNQGRPASQAWITGKNQGLPEPRTYISFPGTQTGQRGEGSTVHLWAFQGSLGF